MPWRWYPNNTSKQRLKDGTIRVFRYPTKRWIKTAKPYKPQKKGLEKTPIISKRFGYLDVYSHKEQQNLICPSGYSISQCFHALRMFWHGYHRANSKEKDLEKTKKYAKKIQDVQIDMGIPTTSFPHLGMYGDQLILLDKKGEVAVFEDHSALKQKQDEYEKWQAENSKKIQENIQKPNKEKGEEIQEFADDVAPGKMDDYEDDEEEEYVPELLEPDKEKGEEVVTMTDDIPFSESSSSGEEP